MRVERVAKVLHDVLANDVVEVALADADQAGHDGQHDHQADIQVEQLEVVTDDDVVDQELEQVRIDQADEARRQDRHEDDDDRQPVRPEEGHDAAHGPAPALLGNRGGILGAHPEPAPATAHEGHGRDAITDPSTTAPSGSSLAAGSVVAGNRLGHDRGSARRNRSRTEVAEKPQHVRRKVTSPCAGEVAGGPDLDSREAGVFERGANGRRVVAGADDRMSIGR